MNDEVLSEQGQLRCQQILLLAKDEARRHRRRRLVRRAAAPLAIGMVTLGILWPRHPQATTTPPIARIPPPSSQPVLAIQYLQTDPTITDRLSIKPEPPRWTSISDRELLNEMAAAGQPAGIVCMNGKTILLPR